MTTAPLRRRAPYIVSSAENKAPTAPKPVPSAPKVAEATPPAYAIEPAWIDTAGGTRTWALRDPEGAPMAEITTKSAAQELADLLNRVTNTRREPSP